MSHTTRYNPVSNLIICPVQRMDDEVETARQTIINNQIILIGQFGRCKCDLELLQI